MSGIKIPVSAELNQQDIGQQIKQVEGALNDLGRVAEEAGRARFTPISKISLDDVRKMRQEFEAMVRLAPGLKKALDAGGQGGRSFDKVDWDKVWKDKDQRGSHAATVLRYLSPESVTTTTPNAPGAPGAPKPQNAPGAPNGPGDAPMPSPGTEPGRLKRAAIGGAAGLVGGAAGQMGGLGGGITSGALAGGLAAGPLGAVVGGLTGGLTSILSMVSEARDLAVSFDTLKRTLGDVGVSFERVKGATHTLADDYALSDTEASSLMKRYANLSGGPGKDPKALGDEVGVGVGFSRSFGLDPTAGVDFFGKMKGLGVTKNADDNKRLALMIGEAVAKAGDLPRIGDVLASLGRYVEGAARTSLSTPGTNDWLARMAALENTGLAGMNPTNAGNIIGTIDNTIRQGGTTEAGKNFMSGVLQREKDLNPIQAEIQMEGGAFGSGKSAFGPESPMAAFYSKFGGGTKSGKTWGDNESTVGTLQKQLVKQYANKSPDLLLNAFKTTFGTSYGQSAAWLSSKPADNDRMISRLQRLGINPKDVSGSGVSRLSQIESDSSLTEAQKDEKTKEVATKNQEDTEGSKAREAAEATANAVRRLADEGLPALTSIQAAVLRIAGVDPTVEAAERNRIEVEHKERRVAIDSKEGAEYNEAQKDYERLVPPGLTAASRRMLRGGLTDEQQQAKDRRDAARAEYELALDAEKDRYGKEKWTGKGQTPATGATTTATAAASATAPALAADGTPEVQDAVTATPGTAPNQASTAPVVNPNYPDMPEGGYPNDPEPPEDPQYDQLANPTGQLADSQVDLPPQDRTPASVTAPSPGSRSGNSGATPELLKRAAESDRKAGFEKGTTAALAGVESSFDSGAVSNKGARGLFQIMPDNVETYSKEVGRKLNPHNNDDAFLMYDKLMAERRRKYGGDTDKMLRSYHGGYDEDDWGPVNRDYLPKIDKKKREMAANEAQRQQQQTYQMPQTMQHAVAVDVTMRDQSGNRMNDVSINTSVGRPTVNGVKSL